LNERSLEKLRLAGMPAKLWGLSLSHFGSFVRRLVSIAAT